VLTDDLPSAERKEMDPLDGLYDQEDERGRLLRLFAGRYASMLRAVNDLLERSVGVPAGTFRLDDPAVRHFILTQAVTRVVRIDDTTQTALRAAIAAGQELGLSSWEIANGTADGSFPGIEGLFAETWRSRHVTVARTELQYAQLAASIDRFRASGIVAGVTAWHDRLRFALQRSQWALLSDERAATRFGPSALHARRGADDRRKPIPPTAARRRHPSGKLAGGNLVTMRARRRTASCVVLS
jgi:hypothetical protein